MGKAHLLQHKRAKAIILATACPDPSRASAAGAGWWFPENDTLTPPSRVTCLNPAHEQQRCFADSISQDDMMTAANSRIVAR